MPESILVFDIGLSNCKTVLFGFDGVKLGHTSIPYPTFHPKPGWVEQNPLDWWQAARQGLEQIRQRQPGILHNVQAISVTGHMHALVCMGAGGEALLPAIVLGDRRSVVESDRIAGAAGLETIYRVTGARMDPSMPAAKLAWLRTNMPEAFSRTAFFLACKDWFRYQLTGSACTDSLDACGTSLYDLQQARWSTDLCALAGVDLAHLPEIARADQICGSLNRQAGAELGLKPGIPVVVGAGDDVEVLGSRAIHDGDSLEHIGTTGSILTCTRALLYDPVMAVEVYPHPIEGRWVLGGSVTAAGSALEWADRVTDKVDVPVSYSPCLDDPLVFLPHLAGERCPHWEPSSRGAWIGLSSAHTSARMRQAAAEGVGFSLKEVLERIEGLTNAQANVYISQVDEEHTASANLRATIYNRALRVLTTDEPTALGAMILAAVGVGAFRSIPEAVEKLVSWEKEIAPHPGQVAGYEKLYRLYQKAGEAYRAIWVDWQSGQ